MREHFRKHEAHSLVVNRIDEVRGGCDGLLVVKKKTIGNVVLKTRFPRSPNRATSFGRVRANF